MPVSTPKCIFYWETKTLTVQMRLWKAKLNMYKYLQQLPEDSLAKEIFEEQKRNKFPGLVTECEIKAKELGISNELENMNVRKVEFKNIVKSAVHKKNEELLRLEMKKYSKLKDLVGDDYCKKEYLKDLSVQEARVKFRTRCYMTELAFNFRNKPEYANNCWMCQSCFMAVDTFSHVKWCVAHEDLREGRDLSRDKDLVCYISEVMNRRQKKDK